ncbi:hypothetical protein [Lysinibacillus sp. FSL K6-4013]|uniref:hypothetical protein n=1 Tax=Lysinibacillus sp. FSL K6-4013 TaxID=2921504 RepID=UPI00315AEE6F
MRNSEPYNIGYNEGFEAGFVEALKIISAKVSDESRMQLAVNCLDYLPLPKIIEHCRFCYHRAVEVVEQSEFVEYVKDKFDSYVENDGFFDQESMGRIYQCRLESAKRDIEDTPPQEIISSSKILSKDLKKMLIEYIEEKEKASSKAEGKGEI